MEYEDEMVLYRKRVKRVLERLTPLQYQINILVQEGWKTSEIAEQLGITTALARREKATVAMMFANIEAEDDPTCDPKNLSNLGNDEMKVRWKWRRIGS